MWRIVIYVIMVIWCIASFPKAWREYKSERGTLNFLEVLGRILMIPAGIILFIAEFTN